MSEGKKFRPLKIAYIVIGVIFLVVGSALAICFDMITYKNAELGQMIEIIMPVFLAAGLILTIVGAITLNKTKTKQVVKDYDKIHQSYLDDDSDVGGYSPSNSFSSSSSSSSLSSESEIPYEGSEHFLPGYIRTFKVQGIDYQAYVISYTLDDVGYCVILSTKTTY